MRFQKSPLGRAEDRVVPQIPDALDGGVSGQVFPPGKPAAEDDACSPPYFSSARFFRAAFIF
jgi:hypothetical protein